MHLDKYDLAAILLLLDYKSQEAGTSVPLLASEEDAELALSVAQSAFHAVSGIEERELRELGEASL